MRKEYRISQYAIFIVERKHFKWNQTVREIMRNRKNIGTLFLAIGMFFNPFGYAELFAMVMKLTGDYWITAYIFYALAFLFFSLSFACLNINPFKLILGKIKKFFSRKV